VKRLARLVALVACASCGKLLGLDEDPSPPATAETSDGGDGASSASGSADGQALDASGQADGTIDGGAVVEAGACKLLEDTCAVAADCCSKGCFGGKCCVADGDRAGSVASCCNKTTMPLALCSDGGFQCCPQSS